MLSWIMSKKSLILFSRNRRDSLNYKSILKCNNVTVVSVLENFDDSPESVIMESLIEGMAE